MLAYTAKVNAPVDASSTGNIRSLIAPETKRVAVTSAVQALFVLIEKNSLTRTQNTDAKDTE